MHHEIILFQQRHCTRQRCILAEGGICARSSDGESV
jgi:hypothetical protein